MEHTKDKLLPAWHEAIFLSRFKAFCNANSSPRAKQRLRNMFYDSSDIPGTVYALFSNSNMALSKSECIQMTQLLYAFLNKSTIRNPIDLAVREDLLRKQDCKCAICKSPIDIHAHADHMIPFKYVGDRLDNNLQMLCPHCNKQKNESIDYQIRYLLKLI